MPKKSLLFLLYHTPSKISIMLTFAGGVFYLEHLYPLLTFIEGLLCVRNCAFKNIISFNAYNIAYGRQISLSLFTNQDTDPERFINLSKIIQHTKLKGGEAIRKPYIRNSCCNWIPPGQEPPFNMCIDLPRTFKIVDTP